MVSIISYLDGWCLRNEGSAYQPTRELDLDVLVKLEQELMFMCNFKATVSRPWFSRKFQTHELKRGGAWGVGTMVCRKLTATLGENLALHHN